MPGIFCFCASICSFRFLKKAWEWRLKSLFLFLLLQKPDGKLTEFFRYLRIVITKIWIYINWMFYIKFPYLRIPKTFFFWLECHFIMKKCPSEMHQFESADPVDVVKSFNYIFVYLIWCLVFLSSTITFKIQLQIGFCSICESATKLIASCTCMGLLTTELSIQLQLLPNSLYLID